ncbi:MAG TPA: hypothetical protein VG370_18795 [Chloroflexota bacterium]|nr:hypothetical protein [Chloroflexota bacterium]
MAEALSAVGLVWATWSWLLLVVALAALVAVAVGWWRGRRASRAADTEHAQAVAHLQNELNQRQATLAQGDANHREAIARLEAELTATRSALVVRSVRSVARALAVLSRDALAGRHYDAVQTAFDDLVQEPGLTSLTFFDPDGQALVATDRKILHASAEDPADREALARIEITVDARAVYVPVMSFTERLGTLRVGYDATT